MRVAPGLGAALGTLGRLARVLPASLLIALVGLAAAWAALTITTTSASVTVVPVAAVSVTAVDGGGPDGCDGPQCGGGGPDLTGPSGMWSGTGATSSSWPGGGPWSSTGDWPDRGRWANVEHWPGQGGPGDADLGGSGGPADLTSGAGGPGGLIGWIMGLVTQVLSSFGLDTPIPGPGRDASTSPGGDDLAGGLGEALPGSLGGSLPVDLPANLGDLPADLGDVAPVDLPVDLGDVLPVELPAGVEEPVDEVPGPAADPREDTEQPPLVTPNPPALAGGFGDQGGEFDGSGDPAPAAPSVWAQMTGLDPTDHRGLDVQSGGWRPQPVGFATPKTHGWQPQAWQPGTLLGADPRTGLGGYLGEVTRAVMTAAHTTGDFPPVRLPGPAGGSAFALAGGSGSGGPGGGTGGGWRGDIPATGHAQPALTALGAEGADLDGAHAAAAHQERMGWLAAAHGFHDPHNPTTSTDPDSSSGTVGGAGGQAWLTGGGMAVPTRDGGTLTLTPTTRSPHARTTPDLARGRYLIHIDNAAAPGSYQFQLDMPAGAHATENTTGGVDIIGTRGDTIATIAAPWARDAHGRDLPTRFQVSRGAGGATVLTQHVGFDETTAFPVLADPDVGTSPGGPDQANAGAEAADTGGGETGGEDSGAGDGAEADTDAGDGAEADTTAPGDGTTEDTTPGDGATGDGTTGDDQDNTGDPADGADPAQDPGTTDEQPAPAGDEQPKPAPATSEQPELSSGPETAPSPGVDTPDIVLISTSGPLGEEPTNGGGGPGPEEDDGGWSFGGFVKDLSNFGEGNTGWFNFGNNNSGWFNFGDGNAGDWNTGDDNTGDGNTGDGNAGDGNTGNGNAGDDNTGNGNAGDGNTGDDNAGNSNTGNGNAGDWNTGDENAGDWNTGDRNSGDWNVGDGNAGDWNVGDGNTGDGNWGDGNSGDDNFGDYNPGNNNIGDFNAGDGNVGDGNAGDGNWGDWNTGDGNLGDNNTGDSNVGDGNAGDGNFGSNNLDSWNFGDGEPSVDTGGSPEVQPSGPPALGVLAGDNLSELARALGVPVEELIAANQGPGGVLEGRDPDLIFPGESFIIPDGWDGTWRSRPGETVEETFRRFSRSPGLGDPAGPPPTPEEVAAATEFYRGMSEKPGEFGKFLRDNPAVVEALASYGPPRTAEEVITAITGISPAEAPPGSRKAYERTELLRAILAGSTTPTADLQAFLDRLPPGVEREKLAGLFADHAPSQVWVSAGQAGEVDRKKLEWFVGSVLGYHPEPGTFGANFVTGLGNLVADLPQGVIQSGIDVWTEAVNSLTTEYGDPPPRLTGETEAQYEARMLPFTDGVVGTLNNVWRRWGPAVTNRDGAKAAHDYFTDPVGTFLEDLTPVAAVTGVGGAVRSLIRGRVSVPETPHLRPARDPATPINGPPVAGGSRAPAAAPVVVHPAASRAAPYLPRATGERPAQSGGTPAAVASSTGASGRVPAVADTPDPSPSTGPGLHAGTPGAPGGSVDRAATVAGLTQAMGGHRMRRTEHLAAALGLTPTQLVALVADLPGYRILGDPTTPHASAVYRSRDDIPTTMQMRHHGADPSSRPAPGAIPGRPAAHSAIEQLAAHPAFAQALDTVPDLRSSLSGRADTLRNVLGKQPAVQMILTTIDRLNTLGAHQVSRHAADTPTRRPIPLTASQQALTDRLRATLAEDVSDEDRVQQGFDESRKDDLAYRSSYLAQIKAEAAVAQPALNQVARRISDAVGGTWFPRPGPKSDARALDKIAGDGGDASRLVDLAGARVEFDTVGQVYQALEQLTQMPGVQIVRFKDRLAGRPQASGYGDLLINLRMPNGHVAELRLQVEALQRIDRNEHVLYEVIRDLEARADQAGRPLTEQEQAVVDDLLRQSNTLYRTALDESIR